ncbi:DUF3888 domain-containing protein [Psychrobacillus sp. L4]|uniref:DUF3888 domain-containing protein n=1 Tax=Psychrobacillus sp. L4 TaxID=3236892 RepID=UPI0036F2D63B
MKRISSFFLIILLTFSVSNLASSEVTEAGRIVKNTYATSEDILLTLIEPDINTMIKDKYGKQMQWEVSKVLKVGLIVDHTKKKSEFWYKMKLAVRLENEKEDANGDELDLIDIRIDVPNLYTEDRYEEGNSKMKISLIEYTQMKAVEND